MNNFIMASPSNDITKLDPSEFKTQYLNQWSDLRSTLSNFGDVVVMSNTLLKPENTSKLKTIKIGEHCTIFNNYFVNHSYDEQHKKYVGEFLIRGLFTELDVPYLASNFLFDKEKLILWVGVDEEDSVEDLQRLQSLPQIIGEHIKVNPIVIREGTLQSCLNIVGNDKLLIFPHKFIPQSLEKLQSVYDYHIIEANLLDYAQGTINSISFDNTFIVSNISKDLETSLKIHGINIKVSDISLITSNGTKSLVLTY